MKENVLKLAVSAAAAGLTAYFKMLALPLIVLTAAIIADYAAGMAKAWIGRELNSRKGITGIIKKLGYLLVVCVGMCVDWLLSAALEQFGFPQTNFFIGLLITIWLIINELISILENLSDIGVPMPQFLKKITAKLKSSVEKELDGSADENGTDKPEDNNDGKENN